jgi:copper chaperone CopZ
MLASWSPSIARAELRDVDLQIHGMDCAICAHAVKVALLKLEGVESAEVSLERASTQIRLRPANRVTLTDLRQIVKNNGFTAKNATVTAIGTLVERGGKPAIGLSGGDTVWLLAPATGQNGGAYLEAEQRIKSGESGLVEAVGIVKEPAGNQADQFAVNTLRPAPR